MQCSQENYLTATKQKKNHFFCQSFSAVNNVVFKMCFYVSLVSSIISWSS